MQPVLNHFVDVLRKESSELSQKSVQRRADFAALYLTKMKEVSEILSTLESCSASFCLNNKRIFRLNLEDQATKSLVYIYSSARSILGIRPDLSNNHVLFMQTEALGARLERFVTNTEIQEGKIREQAQQFLDHFHKKFGAAAPRYEDQSKLDQLIEELKRYPHFLKHVGEQPQLRERLFKWTLRDQMPLELFIGYPALVQDLERAGLNRRTNALFEKMIFVEMCSLGNNLWEKQVRCVVDDANGNGIRNLLNETTRKPLCDAFEVAKKNYKDRRYEVFNGKIQMWSQELLIDRILKGKSWQEGLLKINLSPNPAVCALPPFKVFSAKEVSERWGLSEGNALFRLTVSTGTLEPVVLNNHAILEVVFHDGYQWRLFPFGKYPEHFPEKITTAIPFFLLGSPGVIIYPDIKELVPGRISKSVEVHVPSKVAHTLLEKIGQEIIDTQQKSLHTRFHPRYQNCAQWAEGLVKEAFEAHHIPIDPELNMELYQAVHCFRISNDLVEKGTFFKTTMLAFEHTVWQLPLAQRGMWWDTTIALPVQLARLSCEEGSQTEVVKSISAVP